MSNAIMSQNKENIAFRNSKRVNASLLSSTRTPQSEDFFTDSLIDASKIPSPSPNKQAASQAYKSRRAIGNTRALKSAWDIAGGSRRTSSGSDANKPSPKNPRPEKTPKLRRSLSPLRPLNGTTTPPQSLCKVEISPTSPSSPPRGLTDVYQQIADEEDLTGQEGELGDEDGYFDEPLPPVVDQEEMSRDLRFSNGHQRFQSEPSYVEEDYKGNNLEDNNTVMSDPSGMSFLKELTDEKLAAKLTPHTFDRAKDRERLQKLLNDHQRPIPYSLPRPLNRFGRPIKSEGVAEIDREVQNRSPTASITSERSEPLPRPRATRQWGNRAQASQDWVIRSRLKREYEAAMARSNPVQESSQVDWAAAAAETALPSIEDSTTPRANTIMESSPASLHRQTSLDRIRQWELNDFTGQSLQVSNSPPVRVRTNVLDHIRDREIERLEKQAVTTNRLGELGKRSSDLLRKPSRSPSVLPAEIVPNGSASSSEKGKGVKFVEQDDPIPDIPYFNHRSSTGSQNDSARPEHGRQESHDRLRRLARAMSNSPRSSSTPEEWSLVEAEKEDSPQQVHRMSDTSRKSSKQVIDVESTPQGAKPADTAKTPVVTGAWTDTILPDTIRMTRKKEAQSKYSQTPHVSAGGWIDTPLPNGNRNTSAHAPIPLEEVPEELTNGISREPDPVEPERPAEQASLTGVLKQPEAPKSALGGLLQRARQRLTSQDITTTKEGNDTLNLGDATIESLEDLLTLDNANLTTLIRMGAEQEVRGQLIRGDGLSDMAEAELLERLGGKLERLQTNIHDARKGISKLEHQVSYPQSGTRSKLLQAQSPTQPCDACGCTRGGISNTYKIYISLPFPRLFHSPRKDLKQWMPRPTLLGWTTILLWIWYFTEQAMCEKYCHPLYMESIYEWPADPEPVFPWVLPTMLIRWSRLKGLLPALLGPLWTLMVAFVRLTGQAMGWTDGFVDNGPSMATQVPVGVGSFDDLGMMHDEYI